MLIDKHRMMPKIEEDKKYLSNIEKDRRQSQTYKQLREKWNTQTNRHSRRHKHKIQKHRPTDDGPSCEFVYRKDGFKAVVCHDL